MGESKNILEEDRNVDRILNLPRKVIECIIDFLPVRDAARTCVLSSKWRYVWANHPSLILDMDFWDDIEWNRSPCKPDIDYTNIVSSILSYHVGQIRKFELILENSDGNHYQVPSSAFLTSKLTHLSLSSCIIKAVDCTAGCLANIQSLILDDVILPSVVLTTPLLTSLTLERCCGVRDFDVSAPRLASLTLDDNDYLNLKPFLMCSGINYAYLSSTEETESFQDCDESASLVKLLAAWPRLSDLVVDGLSFKYLATGSIPSTLQLNLRYFSLCDFNLDPDLIPWILCMLKSSPLLHTFEIWFAAANDSVQVNDIDKASVMDLRIDQLPTVKMKDFTASRNEVKFARILLQCGAHVMGGKMLVDENEEVDEEERIKILKKLLLLQRAFPETEIVFGPNLVPP